MEFISDADMQKMETPNFIPDAPDFIPDPSYIGEIGTGAMQGLQSAGSSFAKLGAGAAAFLTGDQEGALPKVNKKIDKFFGVDKHEEMQTIPGKVSQTVANVLPYTINMPAAAVGVGTMYNDLVDQLVSQGIPLARARELALKENAAMLGTAAVVGVPAAKALSKFAKPATELGKRAAQAVGGGAGFTAGVEAQTAVHNTALEDRQDLQRTLTPDERIATFLSGGILGGMHKPIPEKQQVVKPEVEKSALAPEFIPDVPGKMSKGEAELLAPTKKLLEDKAEQINRDINALEIEIGRTGIVTPEMLESMKYLESELNRVISDIAEHDRIMSGDVTREITAAEQLDVDIRKQELIQYLKDKRAKAVNAFAESDPLDKTYPFEVAIHKIQEALLEPKEKVADRILEASDKLDAIIEQERQTGRDRSAIKEALQKEIEAYEAIQQGKTPDFGWFEGRQEPVKPTFKSKLVPTSEEIANLVRGADNMAEVFLRISKEDIGTAGQKQLINNLIRNEHLLQAKFELGISKQSGGKTTTGAYDSINNVVSLHRNGKLKTILHEAVHAATVALLDQGTSKAAKQMIALYERFNASHGDTLKANGNKHYGFTNVKEFVAEAMTEKNFQKLLASIPSGDVSPTGKILKMWEKFKNIIKDGLGVEREARTALDEVLEAGSNLIETSNKKSEGFFQKLSDVKKEKSYDIEDIPTAKDIKSLFVKNFFGMNTAEGFFRDNPKVQEVFRDVRGAIETADKIQNKLWHNTPDVLAKGKVGFMDTLSKVRDKDSAISAVMTTSNKDMSVIHDLFKRGFEEKLEYEANLEKNGQHLTPEQVKVYNTLSKLFRQMYEETVKVQEGLDKKHILPYREGWYPAKRLGEFSVEISYRGNNIHIESFKTRIAAEAFRRKITDGTNLKHIDISDVLTKEEVAGRQPNAEMAEIIGDYLARKYPTAGGALKETIDKLIFTMQTRGGKLGYHHQFRTNVPGYLGTELFRNADQLGSAFKEGIQGEVNNFGMNLRTLMVKHHIEPKLADINFRITDPTGHAVAKQMYETALGRNEDFLSTKIGAERMSYALDKGVSKIMEKALGREFEGRKGSAYNQTMNVAMRVFYATKMMAKPIFILSQILTTPMIIPELAREHHGARAFYSFGKATTKLMTGDKELWNHLKEMSQEYNITESQFLESMNLDKHSGRVSKTEAVGNAIEDYVMLGKVGKSADSLSRLLSYAASYTHYTDLGYAKAEASRMARLATDKAMNTYDSASSAPIFDKLGVIGQGMKPLTSFGINQLGNFISYAKAAKHGDVAPLTSYALIATAMGGVLSLPFIQEYERMRLIFERVFDLSMPSILEIFSGDESFLDRLNITSQDAKDVAMFGLPALSGIDLTSSMRSNETLIAIAAAVALGQEDAKKLFPIIGATVDTVKALPAAAKAVAGGGSVAEGRTAIDALISGPIGYGAKEALGLNTTKVFGQNTDMISTGKKGVADIPRTKTDIAAGFLGGRSVEQRRMDMMTHELTAKEKIRQQKVADNIDMLVETGDQKYIKKLVDLGVTGDQIESGIQSGIYNKNVGQYIRFFMNASGAVDERKANLITNFGIKK